jgi:hypothetical protein
MFGAPEDCYRVSVSGECLSDGEDRRPEVVGKGRCCEECGGLPPVWFWWVEWSESLAGMAGGTVAQAEHRSSGYLRGNSAECGYPAGLVGWGAWAEEVVVEVGGDASSVCPVRRG